MSGAKVSTKERGRARHHHSRIKWARPTDALSENRQQQHYVFGRAEYLIEYGNRFRTAKESWQDVPAARQLLLMCSDDDRGLPSGASSFQPSIRALPLLDREHGKGEKETAVADQQPRVIQQAVALAISSGRRERRFGMRKNCSADHRKKGTELGLSRTR